MKDVAIYGHLVFDTICGDEVYSDVGGIVNVWKAFTKINPKLDVSLCPLVIGSSKITIDKATATREAQSSLNQYAVSYDLIPSKISHIAYLNELKDLDLIQNLSGFVTADICAGKKMNTGLYPYIDLIFVSLEDIALLGDISLFEGEVVIHSPEICKLKSGKISALKSHEVLSGVNVLGAGDYFAASFINAKLMNLSNEDCMRIAQLDTTNYLKNRDKKL